MSGSAHSFFFAMIHFEEQKKIRSQLRSCLSGVAHALDSQISGIEFTQDSRGLLVRIFLDGPNVGIATCAKFSREISPILDVEDPLPEAYVLEVSTPGFERILELKTDFQRFMGFHIRVRIATKKNKINGRLISADEAGFTLQYDDERERTIDYADAISVRLNPKDEEIAKLKHIPFVPTRQE